jgi:hypothetical protein
MTNTLTANNGSIKSISNTTIFTIGKAPTHHRGFLISAAQLINNQAVSWKKKVMITGPATANECATSSRNHHVRNIKRHYRPDQKQNKPQHHSNWPEDTSAGVYIKQAQNTPV